MNMHIHYKLLNDGWRYAFTFTGEAYYQKYNPLRTIYVKQYIDRPTAYIVVRQMADGIEVFNTLEEAYVFLSIME